MYGCTRISLEYSAKIKLKHVLFHVVMVLYSMVIQVTYPTWIPYLALHTYNRAPECKIVVTIHLLVKVLTTSTLLTP